MPDADGVPLIVTTLASQEPVTSAGKPLKLAPVAPVVAYVILVIGVLMQTVCASVPDADVSVPELFAVILTVTVPQVVVLHVPLYRT